LFGAAPTRLARQGSGRALDARRGAKLAVGCSDSDKTSHNRARLAAGATITQLTEPQDAVKDAQILYTDVWISMGQERETATRREAFAPYTVDMDLIGHAPPGVLIMHDLPAHRGEEISDEAMESPGSIVFDQAENRQHAQQALLALILGGV